MLKRYSSPRVIGSSVFLWRLLRGRKTWGVFFLYYAVTLVVWPTVSRLHGEFIACVVSVPLWWSFWYWFDTRETGRTTRAGP
jgi:hypothetical protein